MSGKFENGIWRKVKEVEKECLYFIPPIVLVKILYTFAAMFSTSAIIGVIAQICWNVIGTALLGLKHITMFQMIVLFIIVNCIRYNSISTAEFEYEDIKKEVGNEIHEEKQARNVSVILFVLFEIIFVLITARMLMYFWNNMLTQILGVKLMEINFIQTLGFYCFLIFII